MKRLAIFRIVMIASISLLLAFTSTKGYSSADASVLNTGIKGKIKDADDSELISYATVAVYTAADSNLLTGSISDDDGDFFIEELPEGEYFVEINFIGYNKHVINDVRIDKEHRSVDLGVVTLEKAYQVLNEVEVTAERSAVELRVDKRVVNIDKNLQAKGGSLVEALENTPSVYVDAEGNVMLRGSSSFVVLIDGKPSPLSGSDALRQIPSSAVEKIEIITNPSAKYDPDGTSGIINIIMKKDYRDGFNGLANASMGTAWKRSTDFSMNYRKNKINYFIGGRYAERPRNTQSEIFNDTEFDDYTRHVYQINQRVENRDPYAFSGGFDYFLNDNNVFTLSGEYGHWGFGLDIDSDVQENTNITDFTIYKNTITDMRIAGKYMNGSLSHDYNSENGMKWSNSIYASTWDGSFNVQTNDFTTDNSNEIIFNSDIYKSLQKTDNYELRFKSDFSKDISENSKFEAGYQYRLKDETGAFKFFNFDANQNIWNEDVRYAGDMLFVRHIHSLYGTYSGEIIGFQYQGGLRAEYTDRLLTASQDYEYNKIDLFPTLHISRQLKGNQQIQIGYSRRINRPEPWFLNPFTSYVDSYMFQTGNPALKPELTDSYELNYMKYHKLGFVSGGAYYRLNKNSFAQNLTLVEDGRIRVNNTNIDRTQSYGIEVSSNTNITKFLSIYANANVFNYIIENNNTNMNQNGANSAIRSSFVLNANILATKTTRFQISGFYNSPSITHQGRTSEIYGVNLALNQEFFDKKLSVNLSVRDVFKTMVYTFDSYDSNSNTSFSFNMEQQVVMLSLSYKINNYQNRRKNDEVEQQGGGGIM